MHTRTGVAVPAPSQDSAKPGLFLVPKCLEECENCGGTSRHRMLVLIQERGHWVRDLCREPMHGALVVHMPRYEAEVAA